ncbi:unnamed protein product [Lupinus luteus]|uniref:BAH domain-containing protein n=1 Tax=Lupinus luteus TaxID=3873 RepID=A0AAV1WLE9_LUPLU
MAKTRSGKKEIDSYTIKGTNVIVRAGDNVLMHPPDRDKLPYVARVDKIEHDNRNSVKVSIRWYYRPEDSIGGRREFHGTNELFLSDHRDVQSAHTIEGKCVVHPFDDYIKLKKAGSEDYFCRFEYMATAGTFTPDSVAVYCKCEMPYNPDVFMMQWWWSKVVVIIIRVVVINVDWVGGGGYGSGNKMENLDAKTIHGDGIPPAIKEPCDNLHGDEVPNALECVTPAMDPLSLGVNNVEPEKVEGVQADAEEEEKTIKEKVAEHKSIEDQVKLPSEEPNQGHGDGQVPTNDIKTSIELEKNDTKMTNPESMERKRKQPMESRLMNNPAENMEEMGGPTNQAPQLNGNTHTDANNIETQVNSAKMVMDVLNNMDGVEVGSSLWCNAVYWLEDPVKRAMFLQMRDDTARLAWINFRYKMAK